MDSIALEPEEEFTLSLVPTNPAAMKILTGGTSGLIAIPEIRVVIRDLECKKCLCGSNNYENEKLNCILVWAEYMHTILACNLLIVRAASCAYR